MRLMISGGGTGGHVYPALAVLPTIKAVGGSEPELLWVGSKGGLEAGLLERANIAFQGISAAGLRGKNPLAFAGGLIKLSRGYLQSKRLLAQFQPEVLFVTGGYACTPMTLSAYRAGIPILIYLPDIEPGQAIKFLSRYATKVAVTAPPAQAFFPDGLTVVTGYPARQALYTTNRPEARSRLKLKPDLPVILVSGGSQGARSINKAIAQTATLKKLLAEAQLIHTSGRLDVAWTQTARDALPQALKERYHLSDYLHTGMADALVAADIIISRAGASTLGEATAVGAASILVPYPYSGAHQWANARYLAQRGAAVIVADAELEKSLLKTTLDLLKDSEKRSLMGQAAQALARPQAAGKIAETLVEICGNK